MAASASIPAPARALTRVKLVNKTRLHVILTRLITYVDDSRRPQGTAALNRCIDNYDSVQGGFAVKNCQKTYGGK
jgi:hypothetical protein